MKKSGKVTFGTILFFLYATFILFLFLQIGFHSLRTPQDLLSNMMGRPERFTFDAYRHIFAVDRFYRFMWSSVVVLTGSMFLNVVLSSLAAYGIGRYQFKLRKHTLMYFLIGLMFPIQLSVVPLFLLMRDLQLMNTHMSVILISGVSLSLPILLLNNFFRGIPNEFYESAKIDGASELRIFIQVMFPLAIPVIASMIIITSLGVWNQFFLPMLFLQSEHLRTLPLALLRYRGNLQFLDRALAATVMSAFPILIVYFFFSKKIISGITEGGVKH